MRIVLYGQHRTGTSGLYDALRRSLPWPAETLFEPLRDRGSSPRVLAKVMLTCPGGLGGRAVDYASFRGFDRSLVLVRDPRDWLVSGLLFIASGKRFQELLLQKEASPASVSLLELAEAGLPLADLLAWIPRQLEWVIGFEEDLPDRLLVRYEDFVAGRLAAVEGYLGFPVSLERAGEGLGRIARTRAAGGWRDWLLPSDVETLRPLMSLYLQHYGYDEAWDLAAAPRLRPEHGSDYVAKGGR